MLRFIGGWDCRPDSLQSCARRLQQSIELMPQQPQHGHWGVWTPRPDSPFNDLTPIDATNLESIEETIASTTLRVNQGPMQAPGQHIELARETGRSAASPEDAEYLTYTVRAGFEHPLQPSNHLMMQIEDDTDESTLLRYLGALVVAWQPDHLALVTRAAQRGQGHKPPQAVIGFYTYLRSGFTPEIAKIDAIADVSAADGGHYIRVAGAPDTPDIEQIHEIRAALNYPAGSRAS